MRALTATLAVAVHLLFLPNTYTALRHAWGTPADERVNTIPDLLEKSGERALSEYESGIFTMYRAVLEQHDLYAPSRSVTFWVLVWLALTPAVRRERVAGPPPGGAPKV